MLLLPRGRKDPRCRVAEVAEPSVLGNAIERGLYPMIDNKIRITFIDGSQREVNAFKIEGSEPSDRGDSYSLMVGNRAVRLVA